MWFGLSTRQPGIGVLEPGAADVGVLLDDGERDAGFLEPDGRQQPGHAGADDHHVELPLGAGRDGGEGLGVRVGAVDRQLR